MDRDTRRLITVCCLQIHTSIQGLYYNYVPQTGFEPSPAKQEYHNPGDYEPHTINIRNSCRSFVLTSQMQARQDELMAEEYKNM